MFSNKITKTIFTSLLAFFVFSTGTAHADHPEEAHNTAIENEASVITGEVTSDAPLDIAGIEIGDDSNYLEVTSSINDEFARKAIIGSIIVSVIFLAIGLLAFIFWLVMLIHGITKPIPNKGLWIVLLILFGVLSAIVYYFSVKRVYKDVEKTETGIEV